MIELDEEKLARLKREPVSKIERREKKDNGL